MCNICTINYILHSVYNIYMGFPCGSAVKNLCICVWSRICSHTCTHMCAFIYMCTYKQVHTQAQLCLTLCDPMSVAHQAPLSMGLSSQEYWSGLPCPPPGHLPNPEIDPGFLHCRWILYCLSHPGSPRILEWVHTHTHTHDILKHHWKIRYLKKSE